MPLVKLETSVEMDPSTEADVLKGLTGALVEVVGKPEAYVMASVTHGRLRMAGSDAPAALVEVRSIGGLTGDVCPRLSARICGDLHAALGIAPDRIYLNFLDVARENWGWNGKTFAT